MKKKSITGISVFGLFSKKAIYLRVLLFAPICMTISNLDYAQVKKGEPDAYTKSINQQQEAIDNFDFSRYNPLVEKQIKEEFNAFKVELESARDQDPNLKSQESKTKAFYDKDNANIERWSK
jgi:hypothetical protein